MIEVGLPPLRESRTLRSPEADRLTIDSPAKVLPTCWSSSAGVDDVKLHDWTTFFVSTSHSLTVWSAELVARERLSELKEHAKTPPECAVGPSTSSWTRSPDWPSWTNTFRSAPALAKFAPLGAQDSDWTNDECVLMTLENLNGTPV